MSDATPIPDSLPGASGNQCAHLEVLRRHHANLIDVIDSHESFAKLLHQLFSKKVIEPSIYKKFLIKLDNNPQCLLTVLSGQLLLDISELLEKETNSKDIFSSLCECIKQLHVESAERLEGNGHMYVQTSSFYIMQCIRLQLIIKKLKLR